MDCLKGMKQMEDNSVDLIVTDPPYGYSFMGKDWDKVVPKLEIWQECLRVLKDGAFCFVMSAPRQDVQSQMVTRLCNAGFEIGFTPLYWAYASGFPKAGNISKMVDKRLGAKRKVIGEMDDPRYKSHSKKGFKTTVIQNKGYDDGTTYGVYEAGQIKKTASATPQAKELDGSYAGFQPKPAVEIILVAMKPITEKTYVDQALKNKKGITWLDDCRVPYECENDKERMIRIGYLQDNRGDNFNNPKTTKKRRLDLGKVTISPEQGRFPANLLVSDDVLNDGIFIKGGNFKERNRDRGKSWRRLEGLNGSMGSVQAIDQYGDSGSFSRYFDLDKWFINKLPKETRKTFPFLITPKASAGEKNEGCNNFEEKTICNMAKESRTGRECQTPSQGMDRFATKRKNFHPTVKPVKLMSYLITLGSRENDLILDPFMGSGTTAIASRLLTRNFIGFELNEEYHKIAEARIKDYMEQRKLCEIV